MRGKLIRADRLVAGYEGPKYEGTQTVKIANRNVKMQLFGCICGFSMGIALDRTVPALKTLALDCPVCQTRIEAAKLYYEERLRQIHRN